MIMNIDRKLLSLMVASLISSFICYSSSLTPQILAEAEDNGGFFPALGTWYGDPKGSGSTGGACGWGDAVQYAPVSSMIAAGNSKIYLGGRGCGNCYQIICTKKSYCSGNPITVTITDECPGCNSTIFQFDLSGKAFGSMASRGQDDNLRNLGKVDLLYKRVACNYGATNIAFMVELGTTPNWFATAIKYVNGDGELHSVEITTSNSKQFASMHNTWGAVWAANINPPFGGPFSFRLTSSKNRVIIVDNVIPLNFVPGKTYFSHVNF